MGAAAPVFLGSNDVIDIYNNPHGGDKNEFYEIFVCTGSW
jgi:hypothetical protein